MRPSNKERTAQRRPYCRSARVLDHIATRECWHLDAWLRLSNADHWYFDVQTHAGGWERLGRSIWYIRRPLIGPWEAVPMNTDPNPHDPCLTLPQLTLTDAAHVNALHWRHIAPLAKLWPHGDYRRRSICFHYVAPIPLDPMTGLTNHYSSSWRAERDLKLAIRQKLAGLL